MADYTPAAGLRRTKCSVIDLTSEESAHQVVSMEFSESASCTDSDKIGGYVKIRLAEDRLPFRSAGVMLNNAPPRKSRYGPGNKKGVDALPSPYP